MSVTAARRVPKNTIGEDEFRDMVAKFGQAEITPRWEEAERTGVFPVELYKRMAQAGLIGLHAPEHLGGGDFGVTQEAIAIEEMSKINPNLSVVPLIQGVAGSLLWDFGNDLHHDIARRNNAGDCLIAVCVTEPEAGSDVQAIKTSARRDGDGWVIDGLKSFITLGGDAEVLLVLAQTDKEQGRKGMQFFAVDRNSPGISAAHIKTYVNKSIPTYRVTFDNVRVPDERRLDAGFGAIMAGFNRERIMVASRWLGHMQHVVEWALDYAKVRHQFGRPIGSNQAIAFPLAQSYVDIEATRQLTYEAARLWDSGLPVKQIILKVSSAKLFATQAVYRVTQAALHTGGGWGLTEELPVMRMAQDALVAPVTVGSFEIQLRAIAKELGLPVQ